MRRCLDCLNRIVQARCFYLGTREIAGHGVGSAKRRCYSTREFVPKAVKRASSVQPESQPASTTESSTEGVQAWCRSGDEDLDDQYRLLDERRQAFTSAIRTVKAMTPYLTTSQTGQAPYRYLERTQPPLENIPSSPLKSSVIGHQDFIYPPHESQRTFLHLLYKITQESPLDSDEASQRIIAMFENPRNRHRLSVQAYTIAASFCLRIYNFRLLRRFMMHAQEHRIIADISLCNTVLGIFVHENDLFSWAAALQMFADVGIKANTDTWNQLLTLSDRQQKPHVLQEMCSAGLHGDVVTQGIMLPLQRTYFQSTEDYIRSLKHIEWTPTLGDVLIGELLATKDSTVARRLLEDDKFQLSIEGIEQILSHILRISAQNFNHHKVTRQLCQQLVARKVAPRQRTFLILYRLGRRIKNSAYSDMIYKTAVEQNLVHVKLEMERSKQKARGLVDPPQATGDTPVTWETWLRDPE